MHIHSHTTTSSKSDNGITSLNKNARTRVSATDSFEGVCLTHVILTPGACGGGVRAAVPDTTSGDSADAAEESREACFCRHAAQIRPIRLENDSNF